MSYNFKHVKILIVESSPELFELLRGVLSMFTVPDVNIYGAYSVEEGFTLYAKDQFDMVIIDWMQTPDRGIELTKKIRTDSASPNPFVPIIMTAGSGHKNRVIRARDAGVSEYLVNGLPPKRWHARLNGLSNTPDPLLFAKPISVPTAVSASAIMTGRSAASKNLKKKTSPSANNF